METINLKDKMFAELVVEIKTIAADEIAAFQRAKTTVGELEALRKKYADTAENLREKAKEKPQTGMDAGKIKSWLENKNQVTRQIQQAEEAIKEIDEKFLPDAVDELFTVRERLYDIIGTVISRQKAVYQQKVDDLSLEINAILDDWDGALNLLGSDREIPVPSIDQKQMMQRMADIAVRVKKENPDNMIFNSALMTANAISARR